MFCPRQKPSLLNWLLPRSTCKSNMSHGKKTALCGNAPMTAVSRCLPRVFVLVQVCAVEDGGEEHQKDAEDLAVLPRVPCSVLILTHSKAKGKCSAKGKIRGKSHFLTPWWDTEEVHRQSARCFPYSHTISCAL